MLDVADSPLASQETNEEQRRNSTHHDAATDRTGIAVVDLGLHLRLGCGLGLLLGVIVDRVDMAAHDDRLTILRIVDERRPKDFTAFVNGSHRNVSCRDIGTKAGTGFESAARDLTEEIFVVVDALGLIRGELFVVRLGCVG